MKPGKYIQLFLIVLMVISITGMSLPTFAEGSSEKEAVQYEETYDLLEAYLENEKSNSEIIKCEVEYKVYNKENRLVRFGSFEDCRIKCLEYKCDFLTEVDGTKYYRLNK